MEETRSVGGGDGDGLTATQFATMSAASDVALFAGIGYAAFDAPVFGALAGLLVGFGALFTSRQS